MDDGKSTLIGRLLYDSHMIYEDQFEKVTKDSKIYGTTGDDFDPALLTDGLKAEREQGITIDVATATSQPISENLLSRIVLVTSSTHATWLQVLRPVTWR